MLVGVAGRAQTPCRVFPPGRSQESIYRLALLHRSVTRSPPLLSATLRPLLSLFCLVLCLLTSQAKLGSVRRNDNHLALFLGAVHLHTESVRGLPTWALNALGESQGNRLGQLQQKCHLMYNLHIILSSDRRIDAWAFRLQTDFNKLDFVAESDPRLCPWVCRGSPGQPGFSKH